MATTITTRVSAGASGGATKRVTSAAAGGETKRITGAITADTTQRVIGALSIDATQRVVGAISSTTTVRVPVPIVDLDSLLLLEDGAIMALEGSDAGGFFRLEGTYTL